jgi:YegS/Rv2252/BmrU family lipid kinase
MPPRLVAIVNPRSANGRTGKAWPHIHEVLRAAVGELEVRFTERPLHAVELVRAALREGADEIVSVGGDGTNNEVVNGFFDPQGQTLRPEAILSVVPSGTGGDFRKTLGLGRDPSEAALLFSKGVVLPADVGWLRCAGFNGAEAFHHFLNITSFGIGGLVDDAVNRTTKAFGGKASFFLGTFRAFARYRPQPMRVEVDGAVVYEGPVFNAAVANGQYHGGGMWVAPGADPTDGRLDVVIMGDLGTAAFLGMSRRIYAGTHLAHPKVLHVRGRHVRATTTGDALIDMDGETPGRLPIELGLTPGALRLRSLVPFGARCASPS